MIGSWAARLHPDDRDRVFTALRAHLERREPYDIEYRMFTKSNDCRWYAARGQAVWDDAGRPTRMAGSFCDVTERQRADRALRESERRLAAILDNSPSLIFLKDPQSRYLLVNREFERVFHVQRDEIVGKTDVEIFPKEQAEAFIANDRAVLRSGRPMTFEEIARHDNGLHTSLVAKFPLKDHEGRIYALGGIVTDITERQRMESTLRLSQFMVEHAMDAIYLVAQDAKILGANKAASAMLGYSEAELCAMTVHDVNPDFPAALWPAFWADTKRRGALSFESRHRTKDGRSIPIEINVNYLSYDGQDYHCAFVRDITERKKAEAQNLRQARLLDLIFTHSLDCVVLLDARYNFIRVSESYARACQRDLSDFSGRNHFDLYPSPLKDEFDEAIRKRCVYSEAARPFTFPDHPEWGTTYWNLGLVPILDAAGEIELLLFTLRDVTEHTQAEMELRENEQRLRALLDEREQLARDLHDHIIQDLYAVGMTLEDCADRVHENPLAARASLAQAVASLNTAIDDVRGYISHERAAPMTPAALTAFLRSLAAESVSSEFAGFVFHGDAEAATGLPSDTLDELALIAREAVSNCLRHARARQGTMTLHREGAWVRLSIEDDGIGFDLRGATPKGLGLHNMEVRAKRIGGRLTVVSAPGRGTRVSVEVPGESR